MCEQGLSPGLSLWESLLFRLPLCKLCLLFQCLSVIPSLLRSDRVQMFCSTRDINAPKSGWYHKEKENLKNDSNGCFLCHLNWMWLTYSLKSWHVGVTLKKQRKKPSDLIEIRKSTSSIIQPLCIKSRLMKYLSSLLVRFSLYLKVISI